MPAVLKNILSFTGLAVGVPSVQAHGLNTPALGGVIPRILEADGAGYTITADATNVTVTRNSAAAAAAVKVYCEYWHSIEDAEPVPGGIATSNFPFVVQGGGTAGLGGLTAISAGTTNATGPQVVFQNGGNVTFGIAGNTITASVQTAGGTATGVGLSAGTQSVDTGVVQLINSNGLTWGMSNSSQITGSYSQSTAPNAVAVNAAGSVTAGTVVFSNSNNVTFGLNGSTITASATASQSTSPAAIAAAGSTGTNGTIVFSNSNNVSFGMNGNTITATVAGGGETPFGLSAGTQSVSTGTLVLSDSNGVTFGMSGSSRVTASFSTLVFSNSNNVSFGVSGSTLTATASGSSVVFSNSNNVSFGLNGSTITASASFSGAGGIGISAGTQSVSTGTLVFSNSNGVSFGMSGSSRVTASFSATQSMSFWENNALPRTGFTISFTTSEGGGPTTYTGGGMGPAVTNFNNSAMVQRISVSANIAVTRLDVVAGDNATLGALTNSLYPRIYTMSGSTASMASSTSGTFTCGISTQNPGLVSFAVGTWNLTPGEYMIGLGASYQSSLALFGVDNQAGAVTRSYFYDGKVNSLSAASFERSAISNNIEARPYLALAGTF